ncbi:hypothetical protein TUBRATIS_20640 [Tubulinosema ratisbonensis]|uniref:Uncharacterized protein n=1 Tax=Tubulinosema ratisbonensis TaxID=291195 RepID=A0A437AKA5_9MICR|nr:hypothetical protein TUBRATIS_20640 [Tubulinosema ratisbonensis]
MTTLFIKKSHELLKHASIIKKLYSVVQISPCTLKTALLQIELTPFTNLTITISTSDLDILLQEDTFKIEDKQIQIISSFNIHNTSITVNKVIKLLDTNFPDIKMSNPNVSFKSSYFYMLKIFKENELTFLFKNNELKVFTSEVELFINDFKLICGEDIEFVLRSKDLVFLTCYENEEVKVEVYDTCVLFVINFEESTLYSRVPIIIN